MAGGLREIARSSMDGQGYFLLLLILSVLSYWVFPGRVILTFPFTLSGFLLIGAGLVLAFRVRALFLRNRTTLSPYESPSVLITAGPFRFSRNPAYLAMAAVLAGSALLMGTLVPFLVPLLFIVIIDLLFIPDEERRLAELFREEYREYRRHVRRWL